MARAAAALCSLMVEPSHVEHFPLALIILGKSWNESDVHEAKILELDEITYRDGKLVRRRDGVQTDLVYKRLLFDDIVR